MNFEKFEIINKTEDIPSQEQNEEIKNESIEKFNSKLQEYRHGLMEDFLLLNDENKVEERKEAVLDLYRIQTELGDMRKDYGLDSQGNSLNVVEKIFLEKNILFLEEDINKQLQGRELKVKGSMEDFLRETKEKQSQSSYTYLSAAVHNKIEKVTTELLKSALEGLKKITPGERAGKFLSDVNMEKVGSKVAMGATAFILAGYGLAQVFNPESVMGSTQQEGQPEEITEKNEEIKEVDRPIINEELKTYLTETQKLSLISEYWNNPTQEGKEALWKKQDEIMKQLVDTGYKEDKSSNKTLEGVPDISYTEKGELIIEKNNLMLVLGKSDEFGEKVTSEKIINDNFIKFIEQADAKYFISYEVKDKDKFDEFILNEANRIIKAEKMEAKSAEELTPLEWISITSKIVQDNFAYDQAINYENIGKKIDGKVLTKESVVEEFSKIEKMPLDQMLMEHKKGTCRQYAALTEIVGERLKEISESPFLKNIYIDEIGSPMIQHAWNVIYETSHFENHAGETDNVSDKIKVNMYFTDSVAGDNITLKKQLDSSAGYDNWNSFLTLHTKSQSQFFNDYDTKVWKGGLLKPKDLLFSQEDVLNSFRAIVEQVKDNPLDENTVDEMVGLTSFFLNFYNEELDKAQNEYSLAMESYGLAKKSSEEDVSDKQLKDLLKQVEDKNQKVADLNNKVVDIMEKMKPYFEISLTSEKNQ